VCSELFQLSYESVWRNNCFATFLNSWSWILHHKTTQNSNQGVSPNSQSVIELLLLIVAPFLSSCRERCQDSIVTTVS
jgi:hypothetical protein